MTTATLPLAAEVLAQQPEKPDGHLPNVFSINLLDTCLDLHYDDPVGAVDFLQRRTGAIGAAVEGQFQNIGWKQDVADAVDAFRVSIIASDRVAELIRLSGSTSLGVLNYLKECAAKEYPYDDDAWGRYQREHEMFEAEKPQAPRHMFRDDHLPDASVERPDDVLVPEVLALDGSHDYDDNGFPVPNWGARLPTEVDDLPWGEVSSVGDPDSNLGIYFNGDEISMVPLGGLAKVHGTRRTYSVTDTRGRSEAYRLFMQLPQVLANFVGFRAVLAGLALQDKGLSKHEVNADLADRLMIEFEAASAARQGIRPDPGLRNAGRIRNTHGRHIGTRNTKQLGGAKGGEE